MTDPDKQRKKSLRLLRKKELTFLFLSLCALIGIVGGFVYWTLSDLPRVDAIEEYRPMESSRVYSSDGRVLAELYYERRTFIPYYDIPDRIKKALISIEDARFYSHSGVDFIGIARALWQDIKAGSIVQGGSTITQQLAKMLFLRPEKSLMRKIKEAAMSIQIEKRYTKDEILGLYLNQTYFGTRAFGVEAAAQTHFGKSVKELSVGEAALLAALPKAPALYSPFKHPEKSKKRRALVLRSMLKQNYITSDEYRAALKEPMPSSPHFRKYEAPYFIEFLRQQLESKYGNAIYTLGYKVYSTIDSDMQRIAENAITNGIKTIERRVKKGVQASLIALDLRTGYIKAMVGGSDFWENQFNRAVQALRQPGSAFKPFVYTAALQKGFSYYDVITDEQLFFQGARPDEVWSPRNYDGKYHGDVTLKTALAKSYNAATVNLADIIGVHHIVTTAQKVGIRSEMHPYLSLALGASDLTLIELASAYAALATGKRMDPLPYERIENRDGIVIDEIYPRFTQVLNEDVVDELKIFLGAVVNEGTARRAKVLGRPVYGKTGTTNDFADAWFIGFDEKIVVGVWVGRDNHKPIGYKEAGARSALPIWVEFMKEVEAVP